MSNEGDNSRFEASLPPGEVVLARLQAYHAHLEELNNTKYKSVDVDRERGEDHDVFAARSKAYSKERGDFKWEREATDRAIKEFTNPFRYEWEPKFIPSTAAVLSDLYSRFRGGMVGVQAIGQRADTEGEDPDENTEQRYAVGLSAEFARAEAEIIGRICNEIQAEERGQVPDMPNQQQPEV